MTAYVCAIAMVVGALIYLLCPFPAASPLPVKDKVGEMGRLMYFAGMLVYLWMLAGEVAKVLPGR
jgi:hypothetical protein